MKKVMKLSVIVVLLIAMIAMSTSVFATDANAIITQLNSDVSGATVDMSSISQTIGRIIAMVRNVAVLLGVLIIVILGIKYMMGSLEEKADYKKSFVPLIIGIVVVMAATSIASFLFNLF